MDPYRTISALGRRKGLRGWRPSTASSVALLGFTATIVAGAFGFSCGAATRASQAPNRFLMKVPADTRLPASALAPRAPPPPVPERPEKVPFRLSPAEAEASLSSLARRAVEAIRARDVATLAAMASPDGLMLSDLKLESKVLLSTRDLRQCFSDPTIRRWGLGQSAPEPSTCADYFSERFSDVDFPKAQREYNTFVAEGPPADASAVDALARLWDDVAVVSYFARVPERDKLLHVMCGMEDNPPKAWSTLRLAFRPSGERWVLAGIFEDDWED